MMEMILHLHYAELNLYNEKFKIVTTFKVNDVPCTLDDKLSIFKIGAISTHSKIIIAINTGPFTSILNIYTLNNIKKINYICIIKKK